MEDIDIIYPEIEKILNDLNLGISELDDQHQAFFLHMVGLRRAVIEGSGGRDKLMKTLRFLDTFIDEHFRAEEGYMRRHNYPSILVHRAEHEAFAKEIAEFKKKSWTSKHAVRSFPSSRLRLRIASRSGSRTIYGRSTGKWPPFWLSTDNPRAGRGFIRTRILVSFPPLLHQSNDPISSRTVMNRSPSMGWTRGEGWV